jgi:hypothetical protein
MLRIDVNLAALLEPLNSLLSLGEGEGNITHLWRQPQKRHLTVSFGPTWSTQIPLEMLTTVKGRKRYYRTLAYRESTL